MHIISLQWEWNISFYFDLWKFLDLSKLSKITKNKFNKLLSYQSGFTCVHCSVEWENTFVIIYWINIGQKFRWNYKEKHTIISIFFSWILTEIPKKKMANDTKKCWLKEQTKQIWTELNWSIVNLRLINFLTWFVFLSPTKRFT